MEWSQTDPSAPPYDPYDDLETGFEDVPNPPPYSPAYQQAPSFANNCEPVNQNQVEKINLSRKEPLNSTEIHSMRNSADGDQLDFEFVENKETKLTPRSDPVPIKPFGNYSFPPRAAQESILVSQFKISADEATRSFEKWVDSLWMTPIGFREQISKTVFTRLYVPFTVWQVKVASHFEGSLGRVSSIAQQGAQYSSISGFKYYFSQYASHAILSARGSRSHCYENVPVNASTCAKLKELLSKIEEFDLDVPFVKTTPALMEAEGNEVHIHNKFVSDCRKLAESFAISQEDPACRHKFKHDNNAEIILTFNLNVNVKKTSFKTVFVPFYYCR